MPDKAEGFASDFSYGFYSGLLRSCRDRYDILPLREFVSGAPQSRPRIYLRHDIDISLSAAVNMGAVEAELGISATYMVIPTSSLYDLKAPREQSQIHALREMGHEVSMHFDIATSGIDKPDDVLELESVIDEQCRTLAGFVGTEILSLSFHRPVRAFLRGPDRLSGRVNAYSSTLMEHYYSDSSGRWREGNPISSFAGPTVPAAQVLTHPIYWSALHEAPADRLETFFRAEVAHLPQPQLEEFELRLGQTGVTRRGLQARGV